MMAYLIKKLNLFYISTSEHATTYIGLLDTLKYEEKNVLLGTIFSSNATSENFVQT